MMINNLNNLNNIQTLTKTQNTNYASEKQGSDVGYLPQNQQAENTNGADFKQTLNNEQSGQQTRYAGYYGMFIVSQKLKKSEIINNYNYQMYLKKYAS